MTKTKFGQFHNDKLNQKPFNIYDVVRTWGSATGTDEHIKHVYEVLGYAAKEGYISDIEDWTWQEKEAYVAKCDAQD